MEVMDKREMHRTVYNHLYDMNYNIVQTIFGVITPELMAIMSHDAYAETIQMAQNRLLEDYYNRLIRGAV